MRKVLSYRTIDNKSHRTPEKAESHCLEQAHLILLQIFQDAGIDSAYKYSQDVIADSISRSKLKSIVGWLEDINPDEED